MTEAVTDDDDGGVKEGGDTDNQVHEDDKGENLVTATAAGVAHLVTDAVIVDDDVDLEEGGG